MGSPVDKPDVLRGNTNNKKGGQRPTHKNMQAELTQEAFAQKLVDRIPEAMRESFTRTQLLALEQAFSEQWAHHPVDIRKEFGFWRFQYFFVLIAGREQRTLTRRQARFFGLAELYALILFLAFSTLTGLFVLYLLKSWMGIDLFPNFSFGVWDWWQANVLKVV